MIFNSELIFCNAQLKFMFGLEVWFRENPEFTSEVENEDSVGVGGMILTCDQGGLAFFTHDRGRPGSF